MRTRQRFDLRSINGVLSSCGALAIALVACSSTPEKPNTQALFNPEPPADTVQTITIVHLRGEDPPVVNYRYITQSELTAGATIEAISAITCTSADVEMWTDGACTSSEHLCVYDDIFPSKSTGDLRNFCREHIGTFCSATWGDSVGSYNAFARGRSLSGKFYQICGEDCGTCGSCGSSTMTIGGICTTANTTVENSSGICITGNGDC